MQVLYVSATQAVKEWAIALIIALSLLNIDSLAYFDI